MAKLLGLSLTPIHTHRGPKIVSRSNIMLTLDALVCRDASESKKNETGKINILFLQGAKDSNNQLKKLVNFVLKKNKEINFKFSVISKEFNKCNLYKNIKILKFHQNPHAIYKNIQIAISSVGNSSFELGRIGIPTIHYTIEKREIERAKVFQKLKMGVYINNNNLKKIVNELNKIYFNDNYRKKLIKIRKVFFKKKSKLLKLIENEI